MSVRSPHDHLDVFPTRQVINAETVRPPALKQSEKGAETVRSSAETVVIPRRNDQKKAIFLLLFQLVTSPSIKYGIYKM